jgi:ubiquinone/menaquinone biosynthesis C-methylase UbiE
VDRQKLIASSERERVALFGERAASSWYDAAYDGESADGHALRARMAVTLRLVGDGPGRILDAGMGPGRLVDALARQGWTVSGLDMSEAMVAAARRRLPDAPGRLVRGNIESLPYDDGAFDVVVATGVLEYSNLEKALAELSRVTRSGGRIVVSYPNTHALYAVWKIHVYYRSVQVAKRLLRRPAHTWPGGAGPALPPRFRRLLCESGLEPESLSYASYLLVPAPLEDLFPHASALIGRRLESMGPRGGSWLATQIVYSARKPLAYTPGSPSPSG